MHRDTHARKRALLATDRLLLLWVGKWAQKVQPCHRQLLWLILWQNVSWSFSQNCKLSWTSLYHLLRLLHGFFEETALLLVSPKDPQPWWNIPLSLSQETRAESCWGQVTFATKPTIVLEMSVTPWIIVCIAIVNLNIICNCPRGTLTFWLSKGFLDLALFNHCPIPVTLWRPVLSMTEKEKRRRLDLPQNMGRIWTHHPG